MLVATNNRIVRRKGFATLCDLGRVQVCIDRSAQRRQVAVFEKSLCSVDDELIPGLLERASIKWQRERKGESRVTE